MTPCLYELDSYGEAVRVTFYCSDACRDQAKTETTRPVITGTTTDAIAGTVCDRCGKELTNGL